ncbi:MAG: hypothetical protein IAG13_17915 [Deltaproteobacteria bacterium]|nr:hypothetical protein [Nannocystaceae bacterium]
MRLASLLLSAFLVIACDTSDGTDACDVPTSELSMVATVVDNGDSIHAEVDFGRGARNGPPGPFALCDSDELFVAGEDVERTDRSDRVAYSASLPTDTPRFVDFELRRPEGERIAFSIELAPAFDITAPVPAAEISRSQDFALGWAPPQDGGEMRIELTEEIGYGICLETSMTEHAYKDEVGVSVDDSGLWTIPAMSVDGGARDKCDAIYRLTRFTTPDYPPELHIGGYLEGRVERLVAFVSVP